MTAENIFIFILFIFSIILHECAHGFAAWKLGDNTAKNAGRITLNPIHHIDPFFTILLPVFLLLTSGFIFGGPKPVPVNKNNLRNPDRDMAIVAAVGPLTNFFLSALFFGLMLLFFPSDLSRFSPDRISGEIIFVSVFFNLCLVNMLLACFNLIPIPPLDGSRLLLFLLPRSLKPLLISIEKIGIFLLIILLIFMPIEDIIRPLVNLIQKLAFSLVN